MTSRRTSATGLAVAGAMAAAVIGFFSIEEPATVMPLTLEFIVLAGLTAAFVSRMDVSRAQRSWLVNVLLLALGVRLVLAVVIHLRFSGTLFAPDAVAYEYFGQALADYWRGQSPAPGSVYERWQSGYYRLNGVFFYLFGESPLGPVVLNIFASLWTALLAFQLGRLVLNERVAKTLTLLVAFFPSLILWSVLNIRDAISTFLVVLVAYAVVRLSRRVHPAHLLVLVLGLFVMSTIREYMVFLLILGSLLGVVASLRKGKVLQTMVVGFVLAFAIVFGAESLGFIERVSTTNPLETVAEMRQGMTQQASSAFGQQLNPGTPTGALLALPVGLTYLLFAPFPWAVSSMLQMFTLPEVLLWYVLVPFTVVGMVKSSSGASRDLLIPAGILLVVASTYALVEGNIGTAYRHRAQIMPLLFLFTAAGIERFRARRKHRQERRRRLKENAWAGRGHRQRPSPG